MLLQAYRLMSKLHVQHASTGAFVLQHTVSLWVTLTTGRLFSSHITKAHCSGTTGRIVGGISAATTTDWQAGPHPYKLLFHSSVIKKTTTTSNLLSGTLLMINNAQKDCWQARGGGCWLVIRQSPMWHTCRTGAVNHLRRSRVDWNALLLLLRKNKKGVERFPI